MSSDGRQPPNEGSRKTVVPTASYPPMISGRVHPSAQLSSLRSIPHFSAPTTTTAADSSSSSSPMLSAGRESSPVPVRAGDARAVDDMATSTRHNNDKIAGRAQLPARAKFCQWDVLACINCAVAVPPHRPRPLPPRSDPADETATNSTPTRNNNTRKLGPLLLELRRLNFETDPLSSNIFVTTSICQSRGNPSLGSSVSSTCLDIGGSTSGVIPQGGSNTYVPPCATGLTTGALCIHSFATMMSDDEELMTPSIEYYHTPRHNRPATAVAWRPSNDSHVAIGLTGHTGGSNSASSGSNITNERQMDQVRRTLQVAGVSAAGGGSGSGGGANPGGDRDYCCFVWDIEHQSPPPPPQQQLSISTSQWNRRNKTAPLYKLSHNAGVASLGWVLDGGQTLVVGGQHRNLQMYDLRISATNAAPPVAVFGHNFGVHGIEVDPGRSSHFATYSREAGEAVKLWDARRMDSQLTEIKIGGGGASRTPSAISSVKWSTSDAGHLSIVVGNYLHQYDTLTSGSRAMHTNTIRTRKPIVDFTHYPFAEVENFESSEPPSSDSVFEKKKIFAELLPKRILAVKGDQFVSIVAAHRIAPISVSQRTGQVIHTLGGTLYFGSTSEGPAAMECPDIRSDEDISATMIRRAGCLHVAKYSMSTSSNIKMLANELTGSHQDSSLTTTDQLLRLWRWIQRAEALCCEPTDDSLDESNWPAKGLVDSGVLKLLEIDEGQSEEKSYSESLSCATYDSAGRR